MRSDVELPRPLVVCTVAVTAAKAAATSVTVRSIIHLVRLCLSFSLSLPAI